MTAITAPYRFVPLSNLIAYPDWSDKVSHDKPFKDGVSGELTIALENHTPMCIGGIQESSTEYEPGKIHFFRTPDQNPAIPATSLKGMLRNVLEIASFSKMRQVEDQKLGVRDLTDAKNFYMTNIRNPQAGWLSFDSKKGWVIYPCSYARVHQQQVIDTFNLNYNVWAKSSTIMSRYAMLGICPSVVFEHTEEKNGKKLVDIGVTNGQEGSLVVTGQPGQIFDKGRSAKKYEFVFYNTQELPTKISSTVMSGFRQIHQDTKEWQYWQKNLNTLKHGVPVFYHTDGSEVRSLGLAMLYKLPYKNSIHDAISHTNLQHIDETAKADMSDLLFGFIAEDENQVGLRGRVQIGMAELEDKTPMLQFSPPVVLSAPKPTYYPAYIYQNEGSKEFSQLMQNNARIAGWKRYQAKTYEEYPILESKVLQNKRVQVKLETIAQNSQFSFNIRVHNLLPVELGALLWSLDFGECDACCHVLGMGKPFGLGRVKLRLLDSKLKPNDQSEIEDIATYLQACRLEFQDFMNQVFEANEVSEITSWEDSDTLKALREYATPADRLDSYSYLSNPKQFVELKKRDYIDSFASEFHEYSPIDAAHSEDIKVAEFQSNIHQSMEAAKQISLVKVEAEARQKAKESASEEDVALYEVEDFIAKAEQELTSTMKKNAHKVLKEPYDLYLETFTDDQKIKLKQLAKQVHSLVGDTKQLTKIVEKIDMLI